MAEKHKNGWIGYLPFIFGWLIGGFVGYLILPWEKDALNCTMEGLNCTENVSSQLKVLIQNLNNINLETSLKEPLAYLYLRRWHTSLWSKIKVLENLL